MIKFLKTLTCKEFKFKVDKQYEYIEILNNDDYKGFIYVRQPNSPKGKDWYCRMSRKDEGKVFVFVD